MLLILMSHQLTAAVIPGTLNGIETRLQLPEKPFSIDASSTTPLLITGLFSTCKTTCPANINLLRQVNSAYQADLSYLFINLKPDDASTKFLTEYLSEFAPAMQLLMPKDRRALSQLMALLPENFSDNQNTAHHSGYIYLYHPNAKGLITYRSSNSQHIIDDLLILQRRGMNTND
jgi:cytochrome oxidase Cu insertion factor (SCO1/SenC/PrrC family)